VFGLFPLFNRDAYLRGSGWVATASFLIGGMAVGGVG